MREREAIELFELGLERYAHGEFSEAVELFRRAIEVAGGHYPRAYFHLGRALADLSETAEAESAFRRSIEQEPSSPESHYNLGLMLMRGGRVAEAAAQFRTAIAQSHNDYSWAWHQLGIALLRLGEPEQAVQALEKAIDQHHTDFPRAWHNLGLALAELGEFKRAAAAFRNALTNRTGAPDTFFELAQVLFKDGLTDESIAMYRLAIDRRGGSYTEARLGLGRVLAAVGRWKEALAELKLVVDEHPAHAEAHLELGRVEMRLGRPELAVDHIEQASRTLALPWVWHQLGDALRECGRLDEAVAAYRKALYPAGYYELGRTLIMLERRQEAIEAFEKALQERSAYPEALFELGRLKAQVGDLAGAVERLRAAVALKHDFSEAHLELGRSLSRLGCREEAVAALRTALQQKEGGCGEAEYELGRLLLGVGRPSDALPHLQRALLLQPSPEVRHLLGRTLYALGRLEEAEAALVAAIDDYGGDYRDALHDLGLSRMAAGEPEKALEALKSALNTEPTAEIWCSLGQVLASMCDWHAAEEAYRHAIELSAGALAEPFYGLGMALLKQGREADAVAALRLALERQTVFPSAYTGLGIALYSLGRYDEAKDALRCAIAQNPNLPEALYNLGRVLLVLDEADEAILLLQKALELRADYPEAQAALTLALEKSS